MEEQPLELGLVHTTTESQFVSLSQKISVPSLENEMETLVHIDPVRINEQQQSTNERCLEYEEFVHIENSYDGNMSQLVVTQDKNKPLETETEDDFVCIESTEVQSMQETTETHTDPMRIDEKQQSTNERCLEYEEFVHIENLYNGDMSQLVVTQDKNKPLETETEDDFVCIESTEVQSMQETTETHTDPMRIDEKQQSTNERCLEYEEFVHIENSYDGNMSQLVVTQDRNKPLEAETEDDFVWIESTEVQSMQETTETHTDPMRIDEQQQSTNERCLEHEEFVHIENSYDGDMSELVVITQD